MRFSEKLLLVVFCVFFCLWRAAAAPEAFPPLKSGEKIAFFGDSITQGGSYTAYLQMFLGHTGVRIYNTGVSGDSSAPALNRTDLVLKEVDPDRVCYILGINDALGFSTPELTPERKKIFQTFRESAEGSIRKILAVGKRPFIATPHAYNQYGTAYPKPPIAYKDSLGVEEFCRIDREIGEKYHIPVLELHEVMANIYKTFNDPSIAPDRIHPARCIHVVMAAYLARQMGVSGIVGEIMVTGNSITASHAKAENLIRSGNTVEFLYTPGRLPIGKGREFDDARKYYPLDREFNRETLKVTDLPAGRYALLANGRKLGEFSAEELNAGISLIGLATPHQLRADANVPLIREFEEVMSLFAVNLRFRYQMGATGTDYDDAAARRAWMERWVKSARFNVANVQRTQKYFMESVDGKEAEIKERSENLQQKIFRNSIPEPCKIRLEAVKQQ